MSLLTTKLRKVIGKGSSGNGRGMSWLYVNGRSTKTENNQVIKQLKEAFETYKFVQLSSDEESITFISFIYNGNTGEYVGSCKISKWMSWETNRNIVVDYTYINKDSILESTKQSSGFKSIIKL